MSPAIDHDLTCLNCGYNLRGTDAEGSCPECGMAVRASRREDRLAAAPAKYRRKLSRGAAWFGIGTLLTLPLLYAGLAIATVGAWQLTAGEPERREPAVDWRLRWASRLLLLLGTLVLAGLTIGGAVAVLSDRQRALAMRWQYVDGMYIAGHVMYWMGVLALGGYLQGIAQRIPDEVLLHRLGRFRRSWVAGMAAGIGIALAAAVADLVYRHFNVHYPWLTFVFLAAVLVLLLWLWTQTLKLARQLNRSLRAAAVV